MPDRVHTPLRPGDPERIGPYRLRARLGGGGMGVVYLGRSPGGHTVAVKAVHPELADDPAFRRRFTTEVAAARRVGGFYTAQLVDADPDGDPPWLATAYIPGPSLHDAVRDHGPLPTDSVAALGAGLAEGLAAIHACGIVHRDLKPGNILLAADGPRVIDFGVARALDATSHTRSTAVIGTAAFMSPEQVRGERVGPASDVFAFGCVLAYAATGRSPFGDGPAVVVVQRIAYEDADLTGVPDSLADLVASCLAKEPEGRPTPEELLRRLAAGDAPDERRADHGWLPDGLTEVIAHRTRAARTLVETRTEEPARPAPEPERRTKRERAQRPNLRVGNLGAHPLEVVVDGSAVGRVGAAATTAFPVEPGTRLLRVDAAGRSSAARRIEVGADRPTCVLFDVPRGASVPEPVETVTFARGRAATAGARAAYGAMLVAGVACGALAVMGAEEAAFPLHKVLLMLVGLALAAGAVFGLRGWTSHPPDSLTLRRRSLAFSFGGAAERAVRWDSFDQVSVVGNGRGAELVLWPSRDRPLVDPLPGRSVQGGTALCPLTRVGVVSDADRARFRAALRWFAGDVHVDQGA
jgi:hypothetical protein